MEKNLTRRMEDFHKAVSVTGEEVVFQSFPEKILALTELVSPSNASSPFNQSAPAASTDTTVYPPPTLDSTEPGSKKRKISTNGTPVETDSNTYPNVVRTNAYASSLQTIVKREAEEMGILVDKVKLWVTLTMPKIEDGDNFGVQIQEEVLNELHRAQESALNLRDNGLKGQLTRAKICSKLIKYPHVEDYAFALKEHDEKQIYFSRQHIIDIRNVYAALTDLIHKNITKIRKPKANNSAGLY